jgi:hypothetical protein
MLFGYKYYSAVLKYSNLSFIFIFILISTNQISQAATHSLISIDSLPSEIKSKVRMKSFTEWMSPSFSDNGTYIPTPDGQSLAPSNSFSIVWADYTLSRHLKILFWQRYKVLFGSKDSAFLSTRFRNPRLAIRWIDLVPYPNFSTTYDFYIQPGFAQEAETLGREFEFGFRTVTQYSIPATRWRLGATTEFTISTTPSSMIKGQNYYGWVTTAIQYDLSPQLAAQSFITVNFKQNRGTPWLNAIYDTPLPYIQNGIGYQLSSNLSASLLINNYLNQAPTLKNTWASLWLTFTWI